MLAFPKNLILLYEHPLMQYLNKSLTTSILSYGKVFNTTDMHSTYPLKFVLPHNFIAIKYTLIILIGRLFQFQTIERKPIGGDLMLTIHFARASPVFPRISNQGS